MLSTAVNVGLLYNELIRDLSLELSSPAVLHHFWNQRTLWPKGNYNKVFLGDAIRTIGRSNFGEAWDDCEFKAKLSLVKYPTFQVTMSRLKQRLDDDCNLTTSVIETAKLADRYNDATSRWNRVEKANAFALARLYHVIDKVAAAGRDGKLVTFARSADTSFEAQAYTPIPPQFWEAEDLIRTRLGNGTLTVGLSKLVTDPGIDTGVPYYLFFDRHSINRIVGHVIDPVMSDVIDPVYKSEYMTFLLGPKLNQRVEAETLS